MQGTLTRANSLTPSEVSNFCYFILRTSSYKKIVSMDINPMQLVVDGTVFTRLFVLLMPKRSASISTVIRVVGTSPSPPYQNLLIHLCDIPVILKMV